MNLDEISKVDVLRLQPDDLLVVKLERRPTPEHCAELKARVEEWCPGHKVIVLTPGIDLSVVRPEDA